MPSRKIDPIRIQLDHLFSPPLAPGRGLTREMLDRIAPAAAQVHDDIRERRRRGELGFYDLPGQDTAPIKKLAAAVRKNCDDFIVLGIGGSALGTRALMTALAPPYYNLVPDDRRRGPRLFIADNVDPESFSALLELTKGRRVMVNVISKSGGTAETMSQFMIVFNRLRREFGAAGLRQRLILTTDPAKGNLRLIAGEMNLTTLEVPPNVGGRFSVLTSVGLLPAAVAGIDVDGLLAGAAAMEARCRRFDLRRNPAQALATGLYLCHTALGRPIQVMMPYADGLKHLADWYAQLWAESLGKRLDRGGREVFSGPTPVAALGATDQHSQLQLYIEGPHDKVVMFVVPDTFAKKAPIPKVFGKIDSIAYLGGHDLGELILAEARATRAALTGEGRPNLTIGLDRVDAPALGQVMFLWQAATVFAGGLYNVDPLDQPGVELGKKLTYGLMGRPGFESFAAAVPGKKGGRRR